MEFLKYQNGDKMPAVGLGTWKSDKNEVGKAVETAIRNGYRHIDCAATYGNEKEVGEALRKVLDEGVVKREDLWITSKLWNNAHRSEDVLPALQQTLKDLQLEYLDLYLMHWPVAIKKDVSFPKKAEDFLSLEEVPLIETWTAMEELVEKGLCEHIGVSNFNISKLKDLSSKAKHQPEMNQVELHPYLPQKELFQYCEEHQILMTAYSPLGSGDRSQSMKKDDEPELMKDDTIVELADKYDISPAQLLIAWSVNRGTAVIPKSTNEGRQKDNLASAEVKIKDEDMQTLNQLPHHYRFVDGSFFDMEGNSYNAEDFWN